MRRLEGEGFATANFGEDRSLPLESSSHQDWMDPSPVSLRNAAAVAWAISPSVQSTGRRTAAKENCIGSSLLGKHHRPEYESGKIHRGGGNLGIVGGPVFIQEFSIAGAKNVFPIPLSS